MAPSIVSAGYTLSVRIRTGPLCYSFVCRCLVLGFVVMSAVCPVTLVVCYGSASGV